MNTKDIKKLALSSYTKENLDENKTLRIANLLKKGDLRQYLKTLKLIEKKNTVKVTVSSKPDISIQTNLKKIFKHKKIIVKEDNNLIAGIKIEDFDNVYEFNLSNTLKNIVNYISN